MFVFFVWKGARKGVCGRDFLQGFLRDRKNPYEQAKNAPGEKGRERGEGRDPSVSQSLSTCGCVSKNVFRFLKVSLGFLKKPLKQQGFLRFLLKKTERNLGVFSFLGDGWPDVSL